MPGLSLGRGRLRGQSAEPGQRQSHPRVIGIAFGDRRERDPPTAPRVVRVGIRKPVSEQPSCPVEQLLAGQQTPPRGFGAESPRAECPVKRREVVHMEAPFRVPPVPVRRQHAEREPQIVDRAPIDRPPEIRGVQEICHQRSGIPPGDRGPGHPRESQRTARPPRSRPAGLAAGRLGRLGGTRRRVVVEMLGHARGARRRSRESPAGFSSVIGPFLRRFACFAARPVPRPPLLDHPTSGSPIGDLIGRRPSLP